VSHENEKRLSYDWWYRECGLAIDQMIIDDLMEQKMAQTKQERRDLFVAALLSGYAANPHWAERFDPMIESRLGDFQHSIAKHVARIADAVIEALDVADTSPHHVLEVSSVPSPTDSKPASQEAVNPTHDPV
jgi:hypothetical protein